MSGDARDEAPRDGTTEPTEKSRHFVQQIIDEHQESGRFEGRVHTRFPPEPNGYLHIGHAKSICLNFGIAEEFGGKCNLRFDDTNPTKESDEFVRSIQEDIRWLGFDWDDRLFFTSDYFQKLYDHAEQLIQSGDAYVESLSAEEVREHRGGWDKPGRASPYRDRSPEENLDLFRRMRAGEFDEGTHTLRAKIDFNSPNMNLRDPTLYRIMKVTHHHTGDEWPIYPMYDWAHGLSDSYEGVTHSICTLEFEDHRPLYDWCLEKLGVFHPQQIEFARLSLNYTITSKRKLQRLVEERMVSGWDDPRMPTLRGLRRRGYTPESIRNLAERVGVSKYNSVIEYSWLEDSLRHDLDGRARRVLGVLDPLKVVITNYPEGQTETLEGSNHPKDPSMGTRPLPFSGTLWVERSDFMEDPPKKFFRLGPGREVRLRNAYFIRCEEAVKNDAGDVIELRCTYDPETRGGQSPDGRKVKGTIHWVSAEHAIDAEVRLYDHLFGVENPNKAPEGQEFLVNLNPESLVTLTGCKLEPSLKDAKPDERFQFERQGYFCLDTDSTPERPVFNRAVTLRDTWAKTKKKT